MIILGGLLIKELGWDEATGGAVWWALLLAGGLAGTLADREGLYGRGDEQ